MKTLGKIGRLLLVAAVGSVVTLATGQAQAGESCHKVNAKGVGQHLSDGSTTAQIIGGGLFHGATMAHFEITGFSGTVASIAGAIELVANRGTVTVSVTGTFDVSTGVFSSSGPVTGGTGKLAGATGALLITGVEDLTNGTFVEDISGTICADLSP
jgi:hypothetical protein